MEEVEAAVNGVRFDAVQIAERSAEIIRHLWKEQSAIARALGLKRSSTSRGVQRRRGRPGRCYSVPLQDDLKHYLRDDNWSLHDIANLFGIPLTELRAYQKRLDIHRRRGRKPRMELK